MNERRQETYIIALPLNAHYVRLVPFWLAYCFIFLLQHLKFNVFEHTHTQNVTTMVVVHCNEPERDCIENLNFRYLF